MRRIRMPLAIVMVALAAFPCFGADDQYLPVPKRAAAAGNDAQSTVEHLLQAARHLQAAGLIDEASRVRLEAGRIALSDDVVARKEAQLECLLEELDQLRDAAGMIGKIEIDVVAFDFPRNQLGRDADELDRILGLDGCDDTQPEVAQSHGATRTERSPSDTRVAILDSNPARDLSFQRLLEQKPFRILARPTLRTVTRQMTSVNSGTEIASKEISPGDWVIYPVGRRLSLEMQPIALPGGRLLVRSKFEVADFPLEHDSAHADPRSTRSFNRSLCTTVELRRGQTLVVVQAGKADDDREIVLLATPRHFGEVNSNSPPAAEPMPAEAELTVEELLPFIQPADFEYLPVTPVPRKGATRR